MPRKLAKLMKSARPSLAKTKSKKLYYYLSDFMFLKESPHCERQSSCCQMLNSFLHVNIRYFAIILTTATNFLQQLLVERKTERKRKREVCWPRLKM